MPRRAARLPVWQCLPPQASLDDCLAEREYRSVPQATILDSSQLPSGFPSEAMCGHGQ